MKKTFVKVFITALVVATIVLAANEIKAKGTFTGLTLAPLVFGLVWWALVKVKEDLKEFAKLIELAEDE